MYKELSAIAIFVAVVEEGGFSEAADKLGVTNSVISHHVSKLEKRLGVTLLYRSTRQVSLSDQGRNFYEVASVALKSIEQAAVDLTAEGTDPSGSLNIAMPSFVPNPRLQELIWDFANHYPGVELRVSFSDDRQELIPDGFDVAFRLGPIESSAIMTRKMADIELILVASPDLLSKVKKITQPIDLASLDCISFNQFDWKITLSKGRVKKTVGVRNIRLEVDNIYAARDAAIAALGVIPLPLELCQQEIAEHRLVPVLPEWTISTIPLSAIWNNKSSA